MIPLIDKNATEILTRMHAIFKAVRINKNIPLLIFKALRSSKIRNSIQRDVACSPLVEKYSGMASELETFQRVNFDLFFHVVLKIVVNLFPGQIEPNFCSVVCLQQTHQSKPPGITHYDTNRKLPRITSYRNVSQKFPSEMVWTPNKFQFE